MDVLPKQGQTITQCFDFLVSFQLESFFTLPPNERKFVPREKTHLQSLLDVGQVAQQPNTGIPMNQNQCCLATKEDIILVTNDNTLFLNIFLQNYFCLFTFTNLLKCVNSNDKLSFNIKFS